MKVAISTEGGSVAEHFGRCPAYTILEIEEGRVVQRSEIANPGHQPGFLPRFLSERGVECVIAGGMGPRAQGLFAQQGIETIRGVQGPLDEVIAQLISGTLAPGKDLCGHRHGEGAAHGESAGTDPGSAPPVARPGTRICITSTGKDLEAEVDPRFGRAPYFLLLDPAGQKIEVVTNPQKEAAQGAGIQAARFLTEQNVSILLTGQVGPNAERVLSAAGIQVLSGISGRIADVIRSFAKGVK
jgi:predicted Fe-Mo cluster-binding NifX family protein